SSRVTGSATRLAGRGLWETLVFLLNGVVCLRIGRATSALARDVARATIAALGLAGIAVTVALLAVRAVWILAIAAWQRLVLRERDPLAPPEIGVLSWSGMRGAVSLAAALAIPLALPSGSPLPARNAVIAIT